MNDIRYMEEPKTEEQAIMHLNNLRGNFAMKYGEKNVWYLDMAIEALKKQEEVDVKWIWDISYLCPPDYGGEEFDEYGWIPHCPTCDREVQNFTTRCECGQAIKLIKKYPKRFMEE